MRTITHALVVRQLKPWHENLGKRQRTVAPAMTPSMRSAMQDLKLKSLTVVHAGAASFPMDKNMFALSSCELTRKIHPLK